MGSSLRQAHLIRAGEFCVRLGAPSSVSQAYCQIMSPMPWAAMLRYGPTLVASAARLLAAADLSKRREQDETITGRLDQLEIAPVQTSTEFPKFSIPGPIESLVIANSTGTLRRIASLRAWLRPV